MDGWNLLIKVIGSLQKSSAMRFGFHEKVNIVKPDVAGFAAMTSG
jgi:hypothetical protein